MIRYIYSLPRQLEPLLVCDRCGEDIAKAADAAVVLETDTPGTLAGDGAVTLLHKGECLAATQQDLGENCNVTLEAREFFSMLARMQ